MQSASTFIISPGIGAANFSLTVNNKRERALYLIGFPAGHGAVDAGTAALWIIAPAIAASLGLSSTQVGLIFTVMAISAGMTHIPASLVGETRFRGIFLLSTFWWVAGHTWRRS